MTTICMWSGPRNLSTAMMRSFENRPDCEVWDEPFFAPFLDITGLDHPGREESLIAHETDPIKVAKDCVKPAPNGAPLYFQKHMPHHMVDGVPRDWMNAPHIKHFLLIRDPAAVITSYAKGRAEFTTEDIGLVQQWEFYQRFAANGPVAVLDSTYILTDPEGHLRALCSALDISFYDEMLSWPAGPRDTDGAWAPYWYKNVIASTGFGPPRKSAPEVPDKYKAVYMPSKVAYDALYEKRLKP